MEEKSEGIRQVRLSPRGSDGKEYACIAEDPASIPGSWRSPGDGNGDPRQYSCLGNPMDRGAWQATVHGFTKTWLSSLGHDWVTNKSSKDIPICEGPVSWITKHTVLSKIKESGYKETPKNSFQEFGHYCDCDRKLLRVLDKKRDIIMSTNFKI